jgi:CBS domain-containing protein
MFVKDVMSRRLVLVKPMESVYAALKLMVTNNISGLIVEEKKTAVGVITMADICRRVIAEDKDVYKTQISEVMTKPALTVPMLLTVEGAAALMGERRVKRLVVVDEKNAVVGIVTVMDIVSNIQGVMDVMFKTWVKPRWK